MRACLVIWNWNLLNEENGLRFIRLCCKQILYEIVSYQQYRHRRRMSDVIFCFKKRVKKFQKQYQNHQNTVCQTVNNLSLAKCMSYIAAKCLRFSCHALYIGCIIAVASPAMGHWGTCPPLELVQVVIFTLHVCSVAFRCSQKRS